MNALIVGSSNAADCFLRDAPADAAEPQRRADALRETLIADPALRHLDLEVVRAEASEKWLVLRIRSGRYSFSVPRGPGWRTMPLQQLHSEMKAECLAAHEFTFHSRE